jgi:tyrosinase
MNRRTFVLSSASAAALAACSAPNAAFAPGSVGGNGMRLAASGKHFQRLEIAEFSANPKLVAAFRAGVAAMRGLKMMRNPKGWNYWFYSHWMPSGKPPADMAGVFDQCRHAQSYFLPWHRGFLYFFESAIREASGYPDFALPYWDYYKNPNLPAIFTAPTAGGAQNPLYWSDRAGKVMKGLKFSAFADSVTTFPWGPGETFEDLLEHNPHNDVHDQIGGSMGRVRTAVADPIFWTHHCNIDRLWSAWVAAGGQRKMPPPVDLWWKEDFAYNLDRSWSANVKQLSDTRNLGYDYADLSLPVAPAGAALPARPATVATGVTNGASAIGLTMEPVTVEIPLDESIARSGSFEVILDGLRLSELGERGGFSYTVYANLPETRAPLAMESAFDLGEFGSFSLSMPHMSGMSLNGARVRFSAKAALGRQERSGFRKPHSLLLSFVAYGEPEGVPRNARLAAIDRISIVPA